MDQIGDAEMVLEALDGPEVCFGRVRSGIARSAIACPASARSAVRAAISVSKRLELSAGDVERRSALDGPAPGSVDTKIRS